MPLNAIMCLVQFLDIYALHFSITWVIHSLHVAIDFGKIATDVDIAHRWRTPTYFEHSPYFEDKLTHLTCTSGMILCRRYGTLYTLIFMQRKQPYEHVTLQHNMIMCGPPPPCRNGLPRSRDCCRCRSQAAESRASSQTSAIGKARWNATWNARRSASRHQTPRSHPEDHTRCGISPHILLIVVKFDKCGATRFFRARALIMWLLYIKNKISGILIWTNDRKRTAQAI